MLDLFIMNY